MQIEMRNQSGANAGRNSQRVLMKNNLTLLFMNRIFVFKSRHNVERNANEVHKRERERRVSLHFLANLQP
jgi:hypothetical protein